MRHSARRVIAYYKRKNLIFDTMMECCEYFSTNGQKLNMAQLRRIIDSNGLWCCREEDGTYADVIFDELFDEGEEYAGY